jgi:hypothetical protein
MPASSGLISYRLQFDISPIVMTGGIASAIPGAALPIIMLSDAIAFVGGILSSGGDALSLDDYFSHFQAYAGSTLIDQDIGMYPFANQTVAANAIIQKPLAISMLMFCPAGRGAGYASKSAIMTSIRQSFYQHNVNGGLYTILTPSYPYVDCVMSDMVDLSTTMTKQVQNIYKLDFIQPLVSLAAAQSAYNKEMGQVANGMPSNSLPGTTSTPPGPVVANSAYPVTTPLPGLGPGGIGSA